MQLQALRKQIQDALELNARLERENSGFRQDQARTARELEAYQRKFADSQLTVERYVLLSFVRSFANIGGLLRVGWR